MVAGRQIVQHLAGFFPLLLQIVRHHSREIVVIVLTSLPVGHVGFDAEKTVLHFPNGLVRGNRNHVDGQHQSTVQRRQFIDHTVLDVTGKLLQKQYPAKFVAHDKVVFLEFQAIRTNGVFEAVPLLHQVVEVQAVLGFLAGAIEIMQNP